MTEPLDWTPQPDAYTVLLPWERPPIVQNDRMHHMVKAKAVAKAKAEARACIEEAQIPAIVGADVDLHYRVPDRRRRDADGPAPTLKVCLDAIVEAGILPDDSWIHVPRCGVVMHPPIPGQPGHLWLELTNITPFD